MKQNFLETMVGAVVIAVAAYFLYFAVHSQERRQHGGFELMARFSNVDGLAPGGPVRISGVKVGTVGKIDLDPNTFQATVHLEMGPQYLGKIATDTLATIRSPGLLGDKYLALEPGNADEKFKNGDVISDTQTSPSLEDLLGQVIFSVSNLGKTIAPAPATRAGQSTGTGIATAPAAGDAHP